MVQKISTTIKKSYFIEKMKDLKKDGYFIEYKECKPFWLKRLNKLITQDGYARLKEHTEIVFLVGKEVYRFKVNNMWYTQDNIPAKYSDAIKSGEAIAISCSEIKATDISKKLNMTAEQTHDYLAMLGAH